MTDLGPVLGIDLWHTRLAVATATLDGRVTPVAVHGSVLTPAGVAVTGDGALHAGSAGAMLGQLDPGVYVAMPGPHLLDEHVRVGAVQVDPVDLMAAVLSTVAGAVLSTPGEVVIATPAGFTSRQRQRLRAAAVKAGLGQARLVTGAEAIIAGLADELSLPVGRAVAVIRLDTSVGEFALLQQTVDGLEVLAAIDLGELGEIRGAALVDQAATAFAAAVDSAGIEAQRLGAVLAQAPIAVMPALAMALTAAVASAPAPIPVGELAAALGATTRTGASAATLPATRPTRSLVRAGATATAGLAAAAVLTVQQMQTGTVYEATSISPTQLVMEWFGWGLAPVFAVFGAVALAGLAAEQRAARSRPAPAGPDPSMAAGLLAAAGFGLTVAMGLGLLGAANYGVPAGPLLTWAVLPTVPLAATLAVLAVVVARTPPPSGLAWWALLRPPLPAVLVGAVSTVVLIATYGGVPRIDSDLWWKTEHLAGYGLGWAVALVLVTDRWRRLLLGALLSAGATYAIDIDTATALAACLIVAMTVWAALRLAHALSPSLGRRIDALTNAALTTPSRP